MRNPLFLEEGKLFQVSSISDCRKKVVKEKGNLQILNVKRKDRCPIFVHRLTFLG